MMYGFLVVWCMVNLRVTFILIGCAIQKLFCRRLSVPLVSYRLDLDLLRVTGMCTLVSYQFLICLHGQGFVTYKSWLKNDGVLCPNLRVNIAHARISASSLQNCSHCYFMSLWSVMFGLIMLSCKGTLPVLVCQCHVITGGCLVPFLGL